MTKTSNGVQLSPRQEKEATLVKRFADEHGWEIESIHTIANSTALEHRLPSKTARKDGSRSCRSIQGANTDNLTEQQLEDLIKRQLKDAT